MADVDQCVTHCCITQCRLAHLRDTSSANQCRRARSERHTLTLRLDQIEGDSPNHAGALSRIHHVTAGDYMHEGRARQSIYLGCKDLLRKFSTEV